MVEFPSVETLDKQEVELNLSKLRVYGHLDNLFDDSNAEALGHIWSSYNEEPNLSDNDGRTKVDKTNNGEFVSEIEAFSPEIKYFYRAYAIYQGETFLGEVKEFSIAGINLVLVTDSIGNKDIGSDGSSATLYYHMEGLLEGVKIDNYGVCWAKHSIPKIIEDPFASEGAIIANDTVYKASTSYNVKASAIYFVRPFMQIGETVFYGDELIFKVDNFWLQKANFLGDGRYDMASFAINGKGYIGMGTQIHNGIPPKSDLWEYNPDNDTWTQKEDFRGGPRAYLVSFAKGDFGYAGLGYDGTNFRRDMWKYDPYINQWSPINDSFPGVGRANAIATVVVNRAYIGLGGTTILGKDSKDFYSLDLTNHTWDTLLDYPVELSIGLAAFSIGNIAYVYSGLDFYAYNTINNSWATRTFSTMGYRQNPVAFSIGSKGYLGMGTKQNFWESEKDLYEYDPQDNSWRKLTSLPDKARGRDAAASFVIGNKAYVTCGLSKVLLSDLWQFNPPL